MERRSGAYSTNLCEAKETMDINSTSHRANHDGDPEEESCDSIGIATILPPNNIKTLLYRRFREMATLPQSSQILIGTTATLFLKDMIAETISSNVGNEEGLATLKGLCQSISTPSSPQVPETLANAVNECAGQRLIRDNEDFKPLRSASNSSKKRKRATKSALRAEQEPIGNDIHPVSISAVEPGIVEHEDDYD